MSYQALKIDNLGKRYRLGVFGRGNLKEDLSLFWNRLRGRERREVLDPRSEDGQRKPDRGDFWALRGISAEIQQGETVSVIGKNGAGKSTLLKILSRITLPTEGSIAVRGRLASMLEVGTGFHPELTGRENVFLNGSILGMSFREIRAKFDPIVEFSGVGGFIDTPVKRYSSGMFVRLAFAVAAHLEPDIMVVDEVLAVGDAAFQEKCFRLMEEQSTQHGRTVIFVSHSMINVARLCKRGILLEQGRATMDGPVRGVIETYLSQIHSGAIRKGSSVAWEDLQAAPGRGDIRLVGVRVWQESEQEDQEIKDTGKDVFVDLEYEILAAGHVVYGALWLKHQHTSFVLSTSTLKGVPIEEDRLANENRPAGRYVSRCTLPGNFLNTGIYSITAIIGITGENISIVEEDIISFVMADLDTVHGDYREALGVIRPRLAWESWAR